VEDYIGHGGQGAVYRALVDGTPVALKWYFPQWRAVDVGLRARLEAILDAKRPSDRFLWPIDLVVGDGAGDFGYIMSLRTPNYEPMTALLAGRSSASFRVLTTASYELAHNFHLLHAEGLSYQDISDRNFWFDAETGAIEICDVDNVSVNGVPSAVAGTLDYMAPEIILGEAKPSADSDRYSLAVLIFHMLMIDHPLRGARERQYRVLDDEARRDIYGRNPVFVLDPVDDSNRPVPGIHDQILTYWPLYPRYIQELFVRSFTIGLRSPADRVWESEWRKNLIRMRDAILRCEACSAENFYDEGRAQPGDCWNCGKELLEPLRIDFGEESVVLNTDTKLYEHHLNPRARYTFLRPLACVTRHPIQGELCGLRNDSTVAWTVTTPSATTTIKPRQAVRLEEGLRIDFGSRRGEIVRRARAAVIR
jgi:DNA-binding helix-hairpin-helix protein with protein kinase domain